MADFGGDIDAFRTEVRDWMEANYPAELRNGGDVPMTEAMMDTPPMTMGKTMALEPGPYTVKASSMAATTVTT